MPHPRLFLALIMLLLALFVAEAHAVEPVCNLAPSGRLGFNKEPSEFASCVQSTVSLSRAPRVGQSATLTVSIKSVLGVSGLATVRVGLPAGMQFGKLPAGWTVQNLGNSLLKATDKGNGGMDALATGTVSLIGGQSVNIPLSVAAMKTGGGRIHAFVQTPGMFGGGTDFVGLIYGTSSATTHVGFTMPSLAGVRAVSPSIPSVNLPIHLNQSGMCPGSGLAEVNGVCSGDKLAIPTETPKGIRGRSIAHSASQACVRGKLVYAPPYGYKRAAAFVSVKVYDKNPLFDTELASGATDSSGHFHLCFSNLETSFVETGTADVMLKFISANDRWEVKDYQSLFQVYGADVFVPKNPYEWKTGAGEISGTKDYGDITPDNQLFQDVLTVFEVYARGWMWSNSQHSGSDTCWTLDDCEKRTVLYSGDSHVWPHYIANPLRMALMPGDMEYYESGIAHELGHNVMDRAYASGIPTDNCPISHNGTETGSDTCGWVEGWASWWGNQVMNADFIPSYGGDPFTTRDRHDAENIGWQDYTTVPRGSNVELRQLAALQDLSDSTNDGPWDRTTLSTHDMWGTFINHDAASFASYINALGDDGVDIYSNDFRSTLYGNTIDFADHRFLDELKTVWQDRPLAPNSPPRISSNNLNTSDFHNWVWHRNSSPSQCGERVVMQSVEDDDWYNRTDGAPKFRAQVGLKSFADLSQSPLGVIVTSVSGALAWEPNFSLVLPAYPRAIDLRVYTDHAYDTAPAPSLMMRPGDINKPIKTNYRIRGEVCKTMLMTSKLSAVLSGSSITAGFIAKSGNHYTIQAVPSGKLSSTSNTVISIWSIPADSICTTEPAQKSCQPARVAVSGVTADGGRGKTMSFVAPRDGTYQVQVANLSNKEIGWSLKLN